jgi:putative transposase
MVGWARGAAHRIEKQTKIMPNYKRYYTSNAYYFFTVVTYKRQPIFQDENAIQLFKHSIQTIKQKHSFTVEAIVILPDHIHCIWKMNEDDADYSKR